MLAEPLPRVAAEVSTPVSIWLIDLDRVAIARPGDRRRGAVEPATLHDRRRATARARLRQLLGQCLSTAPHRLVFRLGPWGKPELLGHPSAPAFNIAHSGQWACIAMARIAAIGVDLERLRPIPDAISLSRRHLPEAVASALGLLSPAARDRVFLEAWTREESLRKAKGTGLPGRYRAADGRWHVRALSLPNALVGAVAASAPIGPIDIEQLDSWPRACCVDL